MKAIESKSFIYLFILFHFICHTIITKNIGKVEKKKWRGDLLNRIYRSLPEVRPPRTMGKSCLTSIIEEKMVKSQSKMERFMNCFHIYSII